MKKATGGIISLLLFLGLSAQQGIENLRQLLINAKEDTTRINLMNSIARNYVESRPDLTFRYGQDALALSGKSNYNFGKIEAIRNIGGAPHGQCAESVTPVGSELPVVRSPSSAPGTFLF